MKRTFEMPHMCISLVFFHVIVSQCLDVGFEHQPLNDALLDIRYAAAGRQVRILPSFCHMDMIRVWSFKQNHLVAYNGSIIEIICIVGCV